MPAYTSAVEEVKRAADIVEVIGQYVQLKKVGRNHAGLCPFHAEKAPSFTVSREKQMFHCFGCKKGGDVFAFWMAYHSATFPEALRDLAERYNVTIEDVSFSAADKEKAALREGLLLVNQKATEYFQQTLDHRDKGKPGRDYLRHRGLTAESIAAFRLGYAAGEWDGLARHLQRQKMDPGLAVQAGLIIPRKNGGHYDRFRDRVMFPIFNLTQQAVGFGGRVLGDALPKYLNTPESPVFHKGQLLYGLHAGFQAIRESGRVVLVEGYTDLLSLWQHGLKEVAATLGTALTVDHVRKLKGYADLAVVIFDSDEAGRKAALRSLPLFLNEDFSAQAVVLPAGEDPDTYVKAHGLEGFLALLERALPLFDFYVGQKVERADLDVAAKARALVEILPVLAALRSRPQRALYVRQVSERLALSEEVVWGELEALGRGGAAGRPRTEVETRLAAAGAEKRFGNDMHFLNLVIHFPETAGELAECEWEGLLCDPNVSEVVGVFFSQLGRRGSVEPEEILERLRSEAARETLREALFLPPFYTEQTLELAVAEIKEKARQIKISRAIREARERGDIESLNNLIKLKACRP